MNVVVDTNVLIAAGFNPKSSSAKIVKAIENGEVKMVWHKATKRESRKLIEQIPRLSWDKFTGLFKSENEFKGQVDINNYQFIEDTDDRKFAALGDISGSIVVTNDWDLLSQTERIKTPILTPKQFVEKYLEH